jgi:hypothetical protein
MPAVEGDQALQWRSAAGLSSHQRHQQEYGRVRAAALGMADKRLLAPSAVAMPRVSSIIRTLPG